VPEISARRDFARLLSEAEALQGTILPIDAPDQARVIVTVRNGMGTLPVVHLRDAVTGVVLDRAHDANSADAAVHADDALAQQAQQAGAQLAQRQPGFAALSLPRRILSIDTQMPPGRVMLEIPAQSLAGGIHVEVQQPSSGIVLAGAARENAYVNGDFAEVELNLADGGAPIAGARFVTVLEAPNGDRLAGPSVLAIAAGKYLARIPMSGSELKQIGVWTLHVKATGSSRGLDFERDVEAGFGYAPAHARMTAVATPRLSRAADGFIDEIAVDVAVESVLEDRLGVRATLVQVAADGSERPIAEAQTGQTVQPGGSTITLHFDAKDLAVAQVDGPFRLRDLSLGSYAFSTTQHRLGRGLDLVTPAFAAREIRFPEKLSPAVQELLNLGAL
jgi:hypothetical protein